MGVPSVPTTWAINSLRLLPSIGCRHAATTRSSDASEATALNGDAATSFARLSTTLDKGINDHQAVFAASARSGRDAFTGLAVGMIVASLVMVAGCIWGLSRRLAEYR